MRPSLKAIMWLGLGAFLLVILVLGIVLISRYLLRDRK